MLHVHTSILSCHTAHARSLHQVIGCKRLAHHQSIASCLYTIYLALERHRTHTCCCSAYDSDSPQSPYAQAASPAHNLAFYRDFEWHDRPSLYSCTHPQCSGPHPDHASDCEPAVDCKTHRTCQNAQDLSQSLRASANPLEECGMK